MNTKRSKTAIFEGKEKTIVNTTGSVEMYRYLIPDEILVDICSIKDFRKQFYEALDIVFGMRSKWTDVEPGKKIKYGHIFAESTTGWDKALQMVLEANGKQNIYEYYQKLPWYHSDLFDDQLCQLIGE